MTSVAADLPVIGRIVELWRYPVSTLAGEGVAVLRVLPGGIPEDRQFGLVDALTGVIADPVRDSRWKPCLNILTRVLDGLTEIGLADSQWIAATSEAAGKALTAYFGFPAEIRPYADGPDAEPVAVNRYEPSDLHVLTTASIASLKALHAAGNPDRRRFRPNVLVELDIATGDFPESDWIGRDLALGGIPMHISEHTRRCGLTVMGQADIADDPEILRQLVRRNRHNMGVYALVSHAGEIRVGDPVQLA